MATRLMTLALFPVLIALQGCIGTDIVDEPLGMSGFRAEIEESGLSLFPGEAHTLQARVYAADGQEVEANWSWQSTNEAVATVDEGGTVTATGLGQAFILGIANGSLRDSVQVTVVADANAVAMIIVEAGQNMLEVGESLQLETQVTNAMGEPLDGKTISWASSDPAVATVSEMGVVTAIAEGEAGITAESEGVRSLPFTVRVGSAAMIRSGTFRGKNGYSATGTAVLEVEGTQATLRFESDFQTQSGPGLFVYLSPNENNVTGGINLGGLQSTSGEQSYAVPEAVNTADMNFAIIYCMPFSVPFGAAPLQ